MKAIYTASNSIEAYMILNLLEQAGLSARVDGEYLPGAVGELPALGLVRVLVNDTDYQQANSVIEKWENSQVESPVKETVKHKSSSVFGAAVVGFTLGITVMTIYHNTPITNDGIDYNGDGLLDEKWTYVNYIISKAEQDRNSDGVFDAIYKYDRNGFIKSSLLDEDFDQIFETELRYKNRNVTQQISDTDANGVRDYIAIYEHGVFVQDSILDQVTLNPIKVSYYDPFKIQKSELDTTGDGFLDTVHEYDEIGELVSTREINNGLRQD